MVFSQHIRDFEEEQSFQVSRLLFQFHGVLSWLLTSIVMALTFDMWWGCDCIWRRRMLVLAGNVPQVYLVSGELFRNIDAFCRGIGFPRFPTMAVRRSDVATMVVLSVWAEAAIVVACGRALREPWAENASLTLISAPMLLPLLGVVIYCVWTLLEGCLLCRPCRSARKAAQYLGEHT